METIRLLSASGSFVALGAFLALVLKFVAWRLQVMDTERHNNRLEKADAGVRDKLEKPPAIPDVLTKIIVIALLLGLSAWSVLPIYKVGRAVWSADHSHAQPAPLDLAKDCPDCPNGCRCGNGQCKCNATEAPPSPALMSRPHSDRAVSSTRDEAIHPMQRQRGDDTFTSKYPY